jgi:hypothetical protein
VCSLIWRAHAQRGAERIHWWYRLPFIQFEMMKHESIWVFGGHVFAVLTRNQLVDIAGMPTGRIPNSSEQMKHLQWSVCSCIRLQTETLCSRIYQCAHSQCSYTIRRKYVAIGYGNVVNQDTNSRIHSVGRGPACNVGCINTGSGGLTLGGTFCWAVVEEHQSCCRSLHNEFSFAMFLS